jgi:hypothetical protein
MPDIALLGERTFLFEKLFEELGAECQFLQVSALGSPFLPRYKMLVVPTGFANPQYSKALQSLTVAKSRIAEFIKGGGVLTVYGALVPEHNYDWLPLPLKYVCDYGPQKIRKQECEHRECACVTCTETPECDGYLVPGEGYQTVLADSNGRPILAVGKYGSGIIVVTSIHEFPTVEYLRWALRKAKPSNL